MSAAAVSIVMPDFRRQLSVRAKLQRNRVKYFFDILIFADNFRVGLPGKNSPE